MPRDPIRLARRVVNLKQWTYSKQFRSPSARHSRRIGRKSFPGMSADEVDAFSLGYYAGAMAYKLISTGEANLPDDIAGRVEAEFAHIQLDDD